MELVPAAKIKANFIKEVAFEQAHKGEWTFHRWMWRDSTFLAHRKA